MRRRGLRSGTKGRRRESTRKRRREPDWYDWLLPSPSDDKLRPVLKIVTNVSSEVNASEGLQPLKGVLDEGSITLVNNGGSAREASFSPVFAASTTEALMSEIEDDADDIDESPQSYSILEPGQPSKQVSNVFSVNAVSLEDAASPLIGETTSSTLINSPSSTVGRSGHFFPQDQESLCIFPKKS